MIQGAMEELGKIWEFSYEEFRQDWLKKKEVSGTCVTYHKWFDKKSSLFL